MNHEWSGSEGGGDRKPGWEKAVNGWGGVKKAGQWLAGRLKILGMHLPYGIRSPAGAFQFFDTRGKSCAGRDAQRDRRDACPTHFRGISRTDNKVKCARAAPSGEFRLEFPDIS